MLGGHPEAVNVMVKGPLPCPLSVVPLKFKVKGDVRFPGAEGFDAVPVAVIEMDEPETVTGASV
jgi:hypothetical protein